ncbi:hypothetical protein J2X31_001603 [Flavobacterium arsenatis]|uniref:Amino acid permease n=1 Tax=Flavobacterium arsenatis TaxID=1484332 RepID=A0ABU1TNP5_9FLAO|nr:DUF3810 domain-containing protein [Flavobacterium arsenatis]MDR6967591.1 hypothetical protein [Flavobacterium arsenatis]
MKNKKILLSLFLIVQIIVLQVLSFFPEFIETYYSNGLYPVIAKTSRTLFGWIPFSFGDIIYFVVIFMILRWFFLNRKTWKTEWKSNVLMVFSGISIFYFLFHFLWATNYHRIPLFEKMKIEKEYSNADLMTFTQKLIVKTNEIHSRLETNDSVKITNPYSQEAIFKMTLNGYKNLADEYTFFNYEEPSIKKSLISLPLTYMGFGGYLNPFTNEAQVNDKLPMYNFPFTVCHEMAHQIGYASESEANFIGFLSTTKNKDLYFQYAGYSYALKYCLRNWKIRDEKVLEELQQKIRPGILKNYEESDAFWMKYNTPIEDGFKFFYDNFLKMNKQEDGLESYSKFVNLMVNYYKEKEL